MRSITVSRPLDAPRPAVWSVLADFPNIATWNEGVKLSHATGESTGGVGAMRHCELAPFGTLEETVTVWEPEDRMTVRIDEAGKIPIRTGTVTFTLEPADDGSGGDETTLTTVRYEYQPKFGPIGAAMGPLLDRQLSKGFAGFLDDLERAARRASAQSG